MSTNEESVTITETSPDGTETVVEITTKQSDEAPVDENGESIVEEVIEALFDVEIPDGDESEESDESIEADSVENEEVFLTDEPLSEEMEFENPESASGEVFMDDGASGMAEPTVLGVESESEVEGAGTDSIDEAELAEAQSQEQHAEAAREAQEAADEFVAAGDYEAASEAREVAENEAWEAGDNSILDGSDSIELEAAAEKQQEAENYEQQQAVHAQEGDYEAARDDAANAATAVGDADSLAQGDDHTGQADAEAAQMDWAVHEEGIADESARSAEAYAAEGDFDAAEIYAADAAEHQEMADNYGDLGEHGGDVAVFDPSSEVDSGGGYDAGVDTSVDTPDVDISSDFSTE